MRFLLPLFLLLGVSTFAAENLIENAGFEVPFIKGRTPKDKGGNPTHDQFKGWLFLEHQGKKSAPIVVGLTDEVHHNGKQALYVQFDHVDTPYQSAFLISNFLPVAPATDYQVGISGIMDPKNPMTSDGRTVYLKVEVDYFAKDGNQSVGEPFYAVQPIPGSRNHAPDYKSDSWYQFHVKVTTPADAVFAQVTYRWETGSSPGEAGDNTIDAGTAATGPASKIANGTIFFDDAIFFGPPAANPDMTPEPAKVDDNAAPDSSPAASPEAK